MPDALPIAEPFQYAPSAYVLPKEDIVEKARNFRILPKQKEWQPCPQTEEEEIVVCAQSTLKDQRMRPIMPPAPTVMEEFNDALNLRIGPLEVGSLKNNDGSRALGIRFKF